MAKHQGHANAPAKTHEHVAAARRLGTQDGRYRRGQWVMVSGVLDTDLERPAIHVRAVGPASAELHLVNAKGETTLVLPEHPIANVREAALEEIPAARRPKEHAKYRTRDELRRSRQPPAES